MNAPESESLRPTEPFLRVVGLTHHDAAVEVREKISLNPAQVKTALEAWRIAHPDTEAVLLSTCNRTEFYVAKETNGSTKSDILVEFICKQRGLDLDLFGGYLTVDSGEDVPKHLFEVAAGLDSMVIGEPQVLAQVKEAYQYATECDTTGPLMHSLFQSAIHTAKRISTDTLLQQRRVSIPSVAVADFAGQIFERFDDKKTLVIGAGEMGEETLRYLVDQGAKIIRVINRSFDRAEKLAESWNGTALHWDKLEESLAEADLVISTTGSEEPVVTAEMFRRIEQQRLERPLFILDLAIPRDFEPEIGRCPNVYLYSIDDLRQTCEENRRQREKEMPKAHKIVAAETSKFMAELRHRATGPVIRRLRDDWQKPKQAELQRLFNKLPDLSDESMAEIERSFDRLINKLLHPPLESLRDESQHGMPHGLLDALSRLFKLRD